MKNLGAKIYFVLALVIIGAMLWQLINTKFIYHTPKVTSLVMLPVTDVPVWEASDSASLVESEATLSAQLSAQAYLVMDVGSRTILTSKNADEPLPPASTTKLMTALTALDLFNLNDEVTVSTSAAQENNGGGLFALEKMSVRNLLTSLLVSSANDAAYALAEHATQGLFIGRMNQLAQQLHLSNTHYDNPAGYDDPPNLTTAHDLAVLTLRAIDQPQILERLSEERAVVLNEDGTIRHVLYNTNEFLGRNSVVVAGKTGTTEQAGEVLMSLAKIKEHLILMIVMGSTDRYADTQILINWVSNNVVWPPHSTENQLQ